MPDEAQLRALGAVLRCSGGSGVESSNAARMGLFALEVLFEASPARALQVAPADGVAAGLEACLRSSNVDVALGASEAFRVAAPHAEAARALLRGAPGLLELALARLTACAPRAAALEAGVDTAAARGFASSEGLCVPLIKALCDIHGHHDRLGREATATAAAIVPALVALCAHHDAEIARAAARMGLAVALSRAEAAARLFELGARGAIRGVAAELSWVEHELAAGGAAGRRPRAAVEEAVAAAGIAASACEAALVEQPKLLGAPAAEAWAAAAPLLLPRLASVQRALEQAAAAGGSGDDGNGSGSGTLSSWQWRDGRKFSCADVVTMHASAAKALQLLAEWVPRARRIAQEARSSGAAGPGGCSSGGGGGGETPRRCCAVCGRSRAADGARLRRCRGCGAFTGVMYCGDACAREHWVRRGHRRVCEPASAQLAALKKQAAALGGGHFNK